MEEAAGLNNAASHYGHSALEERNDAGMHHGRSRNSSHGAVGQKAAKPDGEEEERLEAFDDCEIEHHKTQRNHDELTDAIRHAKEHIDLVPGNERTAVIEVAAVPLASLVVVAVRGLVTACGIVRILLRHVVGRHTIGIGEVAGNVGRSLLCQKAGNTRLSREVLHLGKSLLPRRLSAIAAGVAGLGENRRGRDKNCHDKFLHYLSFLDF